MGNTRIIARLDIKGDKLIKGVHLEGLRVVGDPQKFAQRYYQAGIDEIIFMDSVASLYERNNLAEIVKYTAENVFIPFTVGGGIRSSDDVQRLLRAGADKVAVNTAATREPELITEISRRFGSQCMVLSIEAKRIGDAKWEAYIENGREPTGLNVVEWAIEAVRMGAGEILLTSIDQEGTKKGFDCELVKAVSSQVPVPVIASGGMGEMGHFEAVVKDGFADAVAMADVLHYDRISLVDLRLYAAKQQIKVKHVRALERQR
ncbi:imidazole glycerol phosphate synthase subunit HisF [Paenibacillus sp. FSL A5-0031]|uniref:imidazole glycerol phosphate synthase subunit HisF n=1 Tax=Paenibacillus sp. FSL A5-0031 TaxID=1920420 RepID=UPI00096C6E4B|nr:imidazole glycerol phosphate synthase cyclase subunit [Paenibacillus sp. FSL A5-0031]OME87127.1 imidazole glycerol phosphate synthase subunit HisF [Paenibacillus sp. FSL A5-0031]